MLSKRWISWCREINEAGDGELALASGLVLQRARTQVHSWGGRRANPVPSVPHMANCTPSLSHSLLHFITQNKTQRKKIVKDGKEYCWFIGLLVLANNTFIFFYVLGVNDLNNSKLHYHYFLYLNINLKSKKKCTCIFKMYVKLSKKNYKKLLGKHTK